MSFDYEQSIWGRGTATLEWSDPASFRLRKTLRALDSLPAGAKVLEVGCGAGQFIRAIKKIRPDLNCYGCDISRTAIESAKTLNDGVNYDLSTDTRLLFPDKYFNAVLFLDVLEHVENPANFLEEINRVLAGGGVLHSFVPCEGDWLSYWNWLDKIGHKKDATKKFAGHIQFFSRRQLYELFGNSGFGVIRKRFSEHILGQLLGIAVFKSMAKAAEKNPDAQINNEAFARSLSGKFSFLKKSVNTLVNLESAIFQYIPSPNAHITAVKK